MKRTGFGLSKRLLVFLGIPLVFLCSCRNHCHDSVFGSRIVMEEVRTVPFFHSIEILGSCQLFFIKDVEQKLRLEAEHNILSLIRTCVRNDGTLVIDSKRSYESDIGVKIYASMREIRGFAIYGSATVEGEQPFSCGGLDLLISGSGNMIMDAAAQKVFSSITGSGCIFLTGSAGFHRVIISGSGNLGALDFITSRYEITISGSGDCRIHVKDELDVILSGSGSVYFTGEPEVIHSSISGSGRLIKID